MGNFSIKYVNFIILFSKSENLEPFFKIAWSGAFKLLQRTCGFFSKELQQICWTKCQLRDIYTTWGYRYILYLNEYVKSCWNAGAFDTVSDLCMKH